MASSAPTLLILCSIPGKSYTVTGTPTEPGLLPRALDVIFNSLDLQQQLSDVKVRPERFAELRYLQNREAEKEEQWKEDVLNKVSSLGQRYNIALFTI